MIRSCLEFLVSRSIDDGKPLPSWLQTLARRDDRLSAFAEQTSVLDRALRGTAAKQRRSMESDEPIATLTLPQHLEPAIAQSPRSSMKWYGALAVAALLLVMFSASRIQPTKPQVHAGDFSEQLTAVPGEVLRVLNSAAATSQSQLPQLSPLTKLSLPELPVWEDLAMTVESPVRRELDVWQASWEKLKSQVQLSPESETTREL